MILKFGFNPKNTFRLSVFYILCLFLYVPFCDNSYLEVNTDRLMKICVKIQPVTTSEIYFQIRTIADLPHYLKKKTTKTSQGFKEKVF